MKRIQVQRFGPIHEADITFGDLTVLVGPQATGKSLLVQIVKAIADRGSISAQLTLYGFDWRRESDPMAAYSSLYFGGGYQGLINKKTSIAVDGHRLANPDIMGSIWPSASPGLPDDAGPKYLFVPSDQVLLVPAQRVLVLQDGWPKPFMAYSMGDPYCLRRFSEILRSAMEDYETEGSSTANRLGRSVRAGIDAAIYPGLEVRVDHQGHRKRLVLSPGWGEASLPVNSWSAGQREFTPLALCMYWLMPSGETSRHGAIDHVIIEEPEMGLHPQAIVSFMLLVLALLHRGYRVTLSTHSPVVLDVVWAIRNLMGLPPRTAVSTLREVFGIAPGANPISAILKSALQKTYRTYYFDRAAHGVVVRDISSLDPGSEDDNINGWGGLSGFSGRIAEIVGDARTQGGVA